MPRAREAPLNFFHTYIHSSGRESRSAAKVHFVTRYRNQSAVVICASSHCFNQADDYFLFVRTFIAVINILCQINLYTRTSKCYESVCRFIAILMK